ncbi:methyltransferase domain-containing protein [Acidicapsa acidisoli]|uniref:hypothetical protein n=1 Tax=Acidicapsa acidisoli TaxID=1615681 RepID=UPI0021DFB279|nr:hypothetical protein [Acidicapsa acidisoli]
MTTRDLRHFLIELEADRSLLEPDQFRRRMDALDDLETLFGGLDLPAFGNNSFPALTHRRANVIRNQLEGVNSDIYRSIRFELMRGARPEILFRWFQTSASCDGATCPTPGLAYDYQDELLSGILQLREPEKSHIYPGPEMMFYQPTPVRHILRLLSASALSETDILVDLGSGLGHVPLLASILTGARSFGIEVEGSYVASARECAQNLCLSRVQFVEQDAQAADLSKGTVFYLYSPFTGSILTNVLDKLRNESAARPIRICTLGPCASIVAKEPWLKASTLPDGEKITLFQRSF